MALSRKLVILFLFTDLYVKKVFYRRVCKERVQYTCVSEYVSIGWLSGVTLEINCAMIMQV